MKQMGGGSTQRPLRLRTAPLRVPPPQTACQNSTGDAGCADCSSGPGGACARCYSGWGRTAPDPATGRVSPPLLPQEPPTLASGVDVGLS